MIIKYEKNVPLPPVVKPIEIDDWKVGHSFLVPDAHTAERVRRRSERLGFKIAIRKEGTGHRCWRLE